MKRSRSKHAHSAKSASHKAQRKMATKRGNGHTNATTAQPAARENQAGDWRSTAAAVRRNRRATAERRLRRWIGAGAAACCVLAILFVVSDALLAHAHTPIRSSGNATAANSGTPNSGTTNPGAGKSSTVTPGTATQHVTKTTPPSPGSALSSVLMAKGKERPPVKVMFIGGSIAEGEHAPNNYGYLQRAFASLSKRSKLQFVMYDKAIRGANGVQLATMYKGEYEGWLNTVDPGIVVISWGLLNDALPNTPVPTFDQYIKQEINEALAKKAKVMVVTPPVTKSTYEKFPTQEQRYAEAEVRLVKRMRNPNVIAFDVFDQMKGYIKRHHQTVVPYASDPNHPNEAGHALAGRLLYRDIVRKYYSPSAQ